MRSATRRPWKTPPYRRLPCQDQEAGGGDPTASWIMQHLIPEAPPAACSVDTTNLR